MNALTSPGPENSWATDSFKYSTGFDRFKPLGLHYNAYIMLYCKKKSWCGAVDKSVLFSISLSLTHSRPLMESRSGNCFPRIWSVRNKPPFVCYLVFEQINFDIWSRQVKRKNYFYTQWTFVQLYMVLFYVILYGFKLRVDLIKNLLVTALMIIIVQILLNFH